jgi:hypothetical protein
MEKQCVAVGRRLYDLVCGNDGAAAAHVFDDEVLPEFG